MATVTNDEVDMGSSGTNSLYDFSGSTLIQPEKQIQLDIGNQQRYTVLPTLREDVYTISAVGDINGLLSAFPVPHNWQPVDGSGTYEVDRWDTSGSSTGGLIGAEEVSTFMRNALFNGFGSRTNNNFNASRLATDSPHSEMFDTGNPKFANAIENTVGQKGVLQTYSGKDMVATKSLFNEYLTDDGLNTGNDTPADIVNSGAIGTMYGQVQEALISWFEAANYKDFTLAAAGDDVDPRKHDILRSWMNRGRIDQRHLAKMNSATIEKLIATDNGSGKVDETDANTLAYCCFDADQIKQIFSTVEMTGRVRTEYQGTPFVAGTLKDDTGADLPAAPSNGFADSLGTAIFVKGHDGLDKPVPRHKVALRHGEGFAIVVPAKTQLRSGTISEANLMVRIFQSIDGQAVATDSN